ncbi:MAG: hypothetical protein LBJ94_00720 [Puniceicoccales bacterium]|nr:hypothetical protein [Puniceicoccales bacterium]
MCGFSLLEVTLAMGIFAFTAALFIGLIHSQALFEARNQDLAEGMEVMEDFCTFVETSSFEDVGKLADTRTTLYVVQSEDGSIIYRKFLPKVEWELVDGESEKRLDFAIQIEPMEALFADEKPKSRYYIPLLCKLLKVDRELHRTTPNALGENFSTFIAVKNY